MKSKIAKTTAKFSQDYLDSETWREEKKPKYKQTEEHRRKHSETMKKTFHLTHNEESLSKQIESRKKNGWWKNPELTKAKMSKSQKHNKTEEHKKNISKARKLFLNNPKERERMSFNSKKLWANPDSKEKILRAFKLKPNKSEQFLINIIKKNNLPFNYVGDGKIWFTGDHHSFNPDFLSMNPKHIIELFGGFWHNREDIILRDKERLATYQKYGYKTLVIWEHEIIKRRKYPLPVSEEQIVNKIKDFIKC